MYLRKNLYYKIRAKQFVSMSLQYDINNISYVTESSFMLLLFNNFSFAWNCRMQNHLSVLWGGGR